jgi:hypothetical protein
MKYKVPDPVKTVVKKVKPGTFRLFDSGDDGWKLDTGSGNPMPASPFEVLLWQEVELLRDENRKLRQAIRTIEKK